MNPLILYGPFDRLTPLSLFGLLSPFDRLTLSYLFDLLSLFDPLVRFGL